MNFPKYFICIINRFRLVVPTQINNNLPEIKKKNSNKMKVRIRKEQTINTK